MENNFYDELRFTRKKYNVTQDDMAKMLGISTAEYSKIETGQRKKIKREHLKKISAILRINYETLLNNIGLELEEGEEKYYDINGNPLDMENLMKNIYSLNPNVFIPLFEALKNEENIKIIDKMLLVLSSTSIDDKKRELLSGVLDLF